MTKSKSEWEQRQKEQREREEAFAPLKAELKDLLAAWNPKKENLHFESLDNATPEKFATLLGFARRGLQLVEDRRDFFGGSEGSLYADGMFWYDLFLTISSMACGASKVGLGVEEVRRDLEGLVDTLVDISRYSTINGGDITKRNHEALGNILWAFKDETLIQRSKDRAKKVRLKRVEEFSEFTVKRVRDVSERKASSAQMNPPFQD